MVDHSADCSVELKMVDLWVDSLAVLTGKCVAWKAVHSAELRVARTVVQTAVVKA